MTYTMCDYPMDADVGVFPITNIVGIAVAIAAVLMRLANRAMDRKLGLDDYILIFSLVCWATYETEETNRCRSLRLQSLALESSVCS